LLITFEGIDGCGKSTQISLLEKWLDQHDVSYSLYREPGGTPLSETIRSLLLNSKKDMDPVTELLLFSAARSELISEKVKPKLEEGQWVILDRFYDSTTAYQGYGRRSATIEQINELNKLASHNLVPDLTFYLQISLDEAERRTSTMRKDRMEKSGEKFFKAVINGFNHLSEHDPRFHTLDATRKPEFIHMQIRELLQPYLNDQ
jgi:dTMP kinase